MSNPLRYTSDGKYEVSLTTCVDCGEQYADDGNHRRTSVRHIAWVKGTLQPEIPVPKQPDAIMFTEMPKGFAMGEVAVCPRCHGLRAQTRKDFAGRVTKPALDYTTEKGKKTPCIRCNGFGIVPNQAV